MAETLSTLSIISFSISGVSFVFAVFFWFFFKIPTVIGDLSGRTARKSIAKMRAANEKTGNKAYKESKTNVSRGKLTGAIPVSEKQKKNKLVINSDKPETGLLAENKVDNFNSETTGLLIDEEATMELDMRIPSVTKRKSSKKLEILESVMLIYTDEVIQ